MKERGKRGRRKEKGNDDHQTLERERFPCGHRNFLFVLYAYWFLFLVLYFTFKFFWAGSLGLIYFFFGNCETKNIIVSVRFKGVLRKK